MKITEIDDRSPRGKLLLVIGGAASGKSEYAEKLAIRTTREERGSRLWYLATMHRDPQDPETILRIEKHRRMRDGKGFRTVECERDLAGIREMFHAGDVILLEDLSNLLANECFPPERSACPDFDAGRYRWSAAGERILLPVFEMRERGIHIVVVGNRITEDLPAETESGNGQSRERERSRAEDTESDLVHYIEANQLIQCELGKAADEIVEVVCGVPLIQEPCVTGTGHLTAFP